MDYYLKIDEVYDEDDISKCIKDIKLLNLISKSKNYVILECSFSEFTIPLNTCFNYVYKVYEEITLPCKLTLKYISIFARSFDEIPEGYKTICMFEILDMRYINNIPNKVSLKDLSKHIYLLVDENKKPIPSPPLWE